MSPTSDPSTNKNKDQYVFNVTMAAVAGQVGCLTLVIIFAALFLGLWLDNTLGTKPMATVGLTIASIPITLVAMFWVVKEATSRLTTPPTDYTASQQEGTKREKNEQPDSWDS